MSVDSGIERYTILFNITYKFLLEMSYSELFLSLFILFLCLFKINPTFRYASKFVIYFIYVSAMSIIFIPIFSLNPCDVENLIYSSSTCQYVSIVLGIKWFLRGEKYLKDKQPCVIVSNHQSSIDIVGMFHIWRIMGRCTVIAKNELFYLLPFGLAAWLAGLTFIKRSNSELARKQVNETAAKVKKENTKLWVFPEGTRRDTGKIHGFKKGAFYAAIYAQLPILPIVYSEYYFLSSKEKRFDSGKVLITVLPPISTEGMTFDDVEELMNRTKEAMEKTFYETSREVKQSIDNLNGVKV